MNGKVSPLRKVSPSWKVSPPLQCISNGQVCHRGHIFKSKLRANYPDYTIRIYSTMDCSKSIMHRQWTSEMYTLQGYHHYPNKKGLPSMEKNVLL